MDDTMDPAVTGTLQSVFANQEALPTMVIAFHPDLRRVGDRRTLDPMAANDIAIGRASPDFGGEALGDPCISRNQMSVGWDMQKQLFRVAKDPNARRPVRVIYPNETEVEAAPLLVEPGSLIAVGDRVIFLLERVQSAPPGYEKLIGFSTAIQEIRRTIMRLASINTSVLITGEPGAGKEVVAKLIHGSSRGGRPFLAVNCASLPEALIEHELFGHTRGAFTGATAPKPGLFRAANTGCLLLDEIGDLPIGLQAKLLRVLQEKKVRPVGGTDELPIDTRVLAATNRDLGADVEKGSFRADLYSRIEAPFIDVPPLREHIVDVPFLFAFFLAQRAKESEIAARFIQPATEHTPPVRMEVILRLLTHSWPRNVRELQKWVDAAIVASADSKRLQVPEWRWSDRAPAKPSAAPSTATRTEPADIDEALLMEVLQRHDFVARRVAHDLGISRTTLDKRMRELKIPRPSDLKASEIQAALVEHDGDTRAAARTLRVSSRGLKQQLRLLEISDDTS
jgi:transcriptional regulator with PAS, ATPase and Fis domain